MSHNSLPMVSSGSRSNGRQLDLLRLPANPLIEQSAAFA
jgi:hypothetical protein